MRDPRSEHAERRIRSLSAHLQWASALRSQPEQPSPWSAELPQHPQIARSLCKSKPAHREQPAHKVLRAEDAAALVSTGDIVTVAGFVGTSCPEVLLNAVRARYDAQGEPSKLHLVFGIAVGDGKGRGMDRLAEPGLVSSLCYAWVGVTPGLVKLVNQDKVKAWNLPLGCVVGMIRAVACGGPGPVTKIGLGTFADPRDKGGKLNWVTTEDLVQVVKLGGEDFLWYRAPPRIDIALLRGTTADLDGNVSFEKEALLLDQLNQAMAAHNSGGKVIVQVERLAKPGGLHPRTIHLPASIVDAVVLAPSASLHQQTLMSPLYSAALSGEMQAPLSAAAGLPAAPERRIIAHRAFLEIDHPGSVVNLGVGMPEGVSAVAASLPEQNPNASGMSMSTEAGIIGGFPRGGLEFGTAVNAGFFTSQSSILDFYNGGGIDIACLGMAEVDGDGNVNVSNFGEGRMPGCGGFVDISQCARKVVFLGTLTGGGLKVAVQHGKLRIVQEGRARKFRQQVVEKTFAGSSVGSRSVLFITERAVFRLQPSGGGLELVEVAPGVDVQREVLGVMDCKPAVSQNLRLMDPRIFQTFSSA